MEIELATTIGAVTVYPDRALIVRRGTATVESAGEHTLRIGGLPPRVQRDSLRATGRGPAGTRILGVEQAPEFHAAAPEETLRQLKTEIERLEQELALLDERSRVFEEQQRWLGNLAEHSTRSLAWSMARGGAKPDDISVFFAYAGEESQRIAAARLEVQRERAKTSESLDARRREYAGLGSGRLPDRLAATVRVVLPAAGEVEIELSYLITGAEWHPRYDARVDARESRVRLTQQALVSQRTGEDWSQVALSLSTARPSMARQLPDEPDPWYVNIAQPVTYSMAMPPAPAAPAPKARVMHMARMSPESTFPPGVSFDSFEPVEMEMAAPALEYSGAALLFRLPGGVDVPSDGSPHTLGLGEYELPCRLDYVAMPAMMEGAHQRATARNTTGQVLLPGELHVFHVVGTGDEYAGATRLDLTADGAELTLYLGVDDNIPVKRELVERDTDKGSLLQGGVRRVTVGYRVTLANRTTAPQRIVLKDRLPVPQYERIKVKVLDIRPQPSERTRLEQLTWDLTLAPDEERRVEWRFVVEAPADTEVVGLP